MAGRRKMAGVTAATLTAAAAVTAYDLIQRRHAILRNFPVLGHARYLLEEVGPELRQYIVTSNTEERPFNREQRRWIYASSKQENNYFGFGTEQGSRDVAELLHHQALAVPDPGAACRATPDYDDQYRDPRRQGDGRPAGGPKAFRPESVVNVSAMSYGALSSNAIAALNHGATHRRLPAQHRRGRDLAASPAGRRSDLAARQRLLRRPRRARALRSRAAGRHGSPPNQVRAIEIKLSQGAKPGLGGVLPAAKVTPEIARIRGVPQGAGLHQPGGAPRVPRRRLAARLRRADRRGDRPAGGHQVGGRRTEPVDRARRARWPSGDRGVDFVTVDGGEGGTGAGPLVFTDQVALPFKVGFSRVYREFAQRGITDRVVFIGSGKLGFPHESTLAFGLGCDMVNVAREAMMAIGCIQAQRCHTGRCPTGVATQNPWLVHGLDPELKAARLANYVLTLAQGSSRVEPGVRRDAPGADLARPRRRARRPLRGDVGAGDLRLRAGLGCSGGRQRVTLASSSFTAAALSCSSAVHRART